MKTILILISFVTITTSGNSQGRYRTFVRTVKNLSDVVDIMSTAYDAYQYLAPETSYPIRKEDYSKVYNQNWSNIISKNYKPILPSVQFEDNARKLALDYRKWANSTSELASKYGKTSKYDLDRTTNGVPNNSYFRKSYTQGKKEFHKTYPLENYDLEEKDLITIHDLLRPHNEQDISKIFSELKKADLSSNSTQGKTSNRFKEDLFFKFLEIKSAIEFEGPQNTLDLNVEYDKKIIWKLTP